MIQVNIQWPEGALTKADRRATFRRSVGRSMRRGLQDIADEAREATNPLFPHIASEYRVVQVSATDEIAMAIINDHPHWLWVEVDTRPHMPPWGEGTELNEWSERIGANPFLIARHIAQFGTQGHYFLSDAVEEGEDDLLDRLGDTVGRWVDRFGAVEVP